jgi:hypothetical protein
MQLRSVPIFKHEYGVVVAKEKSAQVEPWALHLGISGNRSVPWRGERTEVSEVN